MKQQLLEKILSALRLKRDLLQRATLAAHDAATNEESAAENKYDTRGLEAAYLAGAQARRLADLESSIRTIERFKPRVFGADDPIAVGALVELDNGEENRVVFVAPCAGGLTVDLERRRVSVISPHSPLALRLIGGCEGDEISMTIGGRSLEYEVLAVT